ncbi:ribonuclease H-like domain-containing protein, partial [Phlyctochytrium arcticum]
MSTDLVGSLLSSLSLQGDADGLIPHCPYDFIIAMDLEATCDENHADPSAIQVPRDKGEIIELSYAVVSVPERRIVHQRQNFVRPEETVVTPFCTQLTGITPETVANAGTLREAVDDLLSFVQTNPQSTFCFMAHGEWDFRYQLPRECQEKGIPLPSLFTSFFDITKEVQRMMSLSAGFTRPTNRASLLSLCKMMGLQHEGRLHNGLDDAVTVARLAIVLLQRVHTHFAEKPDAPLAPGFELPLTFPIDLAHEIENFVVARSRVIRLGGIPFKATQSQVSNFIGQSGVQSESVWMIRNAEGRSDGRGLAVLRTHEDAVAALVVNGRVMGDRTVQVTPGCEGDLEETASIRGPFLTEEEAQMAAPTQTVKPGDWMCPTCQFHNFASRRTCSKCHATNPSPTPYVSNQPLKPGDWICQDPACSFQNFASRMLCMRCRG